MKVVSVVGARPQFIKAAVVSRAIAKWNEEHPGSVREVLLHTGQHHDVNMSDLFFEQLALPQPGHHLGVSGGTHGEMTGRMLERLEPVLQQESPDWVIVHGDTNSTLAGALAAAKLGLRVAHVESGLRSYKRTMPEEVNRVVADHLATLLFAPTAAAVENLAREGIAGDRVAVVGDVMYDAALHLAGTAIASPGTQQLMGELAEAFLVATVHRAENTDDPRRLRAILEALDAVATKRAVVLPLHPRTRKRMGSWRPANALRIVEAIGYLDMIHLLRACAGVITDSGGLQKEAYFFRRRCLVLREETEWVELVDGGFARLVGADRDAIVREAATFLGRPLTGTAELYGDGHAGDRIVAALVGRTA